MSDYYFSTEGLTVGYDGRPVVKNISLELSRGEILTLIGPNGAGKSTILKSITRQLAMLGGTVTLDGRSLGGYTGEELAKKMAILMTQRIRPELMTCWDVAATGRYPYTGRMGILTPEDKDKVAEALRLVHAEELAERSFARISDGQRQRIMLARALCQEPEILILDEPTSFLDIRHKLELLAILKDMVRQRQLAVVMSLHELDLAQKISDTVLCIRGDKVDRAGPPEKVFAEDYIHTLYGVERGSYNAAFGSLELEKPAGEPRVFVIGGGGAGIPVYRSLQRRGIPFIAGVLHRNDLDAPVAKALAARVVEEQPFEPIGEAAFAEAKALMEQCDTVFCPVEDFGTMNDANRRLRELAVQTGKWKETL